MLVIQLCHPRLPFQLLDIPDVLRLPKALGVLAAWHLGLLPSLCSLGVRHHKAAKQDKLVSAIMQLSGQLSMKSTAPGRLLQRVAGCGPGLLFLFTITPG